MRHFLSPAEQRLLDSLPASEAEVVRALFDELDAHLVEEPSLNWMKESRPRPDAWWNKETAA